MQLITNVISEARARFEEDGVLYMMWGILLFVAATGQYVLLTNGYQQVSFYPYYLFPFGGLFSWWYYARKVGRQRNGMLSTIAVIWLLLSLNMMILGFFFWPMLKANLIPVLLILLGVGVMISGRMIQSRPVILAGALINLAGLVGFGLEWIMHPLLLGFSGLLFIFVPGLYLKWYKK
ncbi:MAG: hypothetical protein AAF598_01565 [Bacteroidota bacterium]